MTPDRAPARFAVARRSGRPAELRASLEKAHHAGRAGDAQMLRTVMELVLALSVHDKASRGPSERVRAFTDMLAEGPVCLSSCYAAYVAPPPDAVLLSDVSPGSSPGRRRLLLVS